MTDQAENMALWNQVSETDPNFTKEVNQRGGFTCINATYQIKQATKLWGAYGNPRWWLDYTKDDMKIGKFLVILFGTFRYPGGEFPITNAVKLSTSKGPDEDAFKKLETDTITKALSKLGFSADIFTGCWDQQKYTDHNNHQQHQPQHQQQPQQGYHQ